MVCRLEFWFQMSKSKQKMICIRVVPILQKLRYLKNQVMWSNTLLWGMFMPIFKLLPLKLTSHWIAQFYEAISLNFRLIKYSDAWKLTFFSLKLSWNDFKVIYPWIEVKKCLHKKFGVFGGIELGFEGGLKTLILSNFWAFSRCLDPPQTPTQWPHWPQILFVDTFCLQFKHILLWNHFKII